jgi:MoaA/NifB/PqqE/SkfB family radical SAM enzyme
MRPTRTAVQSGSRPWPARLRERLRCWRRRLRGLPRAPQWLQVEINNSCNLACIMCPRTALQRPVRLMSLAEFQDLAEGAVAAGIPRLRLFLLGEPLLHPELTEMIRCAKSLGVPSVEINTNAMALSPERSRELVAAGLDEVVFSLDGADAQSYEAIRRGGDYEQVVSNLEAFFRVRAESGRERPRGIVQTILMQPTAGQMEDFMRRWRPVADLVRVEAIREYQGIEGLSPFNLAARGELRPCPALWSYLVVLSDLRVVPCCTDINGELALGDVREAPLPQWWRHPRLQALRRAHLALDFTDLPLCAACEFTSLDLLREKARATCEWGVGQASRLSRTEKGD